MKFWFVAGVFLISLLGGSLYLTLREAKLSRQPSGMGSTASTTLLSPPLFENKGDVLQQMATAHYKEDVYRYHFYPVDRSGRLQLFPNFEEQKTAQDLQRAQSCSFLVNGSFYTPDQRPLGWFISNYQLLKSPVENNLIDGFMFRTTDDVVHIGLDFPQESVVWGIQAGPLLRFEHEPLELKILHDKLARRIVAGIQNNGDIFFMVIVHDKSLVSGPFLGELPQILDTILADLDISSPVALNLDGGAASAYLAPDFLISEFSWIGSFFCLPPPITSSGFPSCHINTNCVI